MKKDPSGFVEARLMKKFVPRIGILESEECLSKRLTVAGGGGDDI